MKSKNKCNNLFSLFVALPAKYCLIIYITINYIPFFSNCQTIWLSGNNSMQMYVALAGHCYFKLKCKKMDKNILYYNLPVRAVILSR